MKNREYAPAENAPSPEKPQIIEKIVYIEKPVQVELTDKKYKRWMVRGMNFAVLGFFGGIIGALVAGNYHQGGWAVFSLVMSFVLFGIGTFIKKTAQYAAWWNNG